MSRRWLIVVRILVGLVVALLVGTLAWYVSGMNVAVLNPQGPVGEQERRLLTIAIVLALSVLLPIYGLFIAIVVKYRAGNETSTYTPEWDHYWAVEVVRWVVFCSVIAILAVVCVVSSRLLDPYKPIEADTKPMVIQVVALQWKWLFIYPEQHIATVNFVEFPEKTPVTFELTADAPMNSFWIPQLGGQMYAMSGMVNKLNLMADHTGEYDGSDAEISGAGFADMRFKALSVKADKFDQWVAGAKQSPERLTKDVYTDLAKPEQPTAPMIKTYSSVDAGLYDTIVMKYVQPSTTPTPSPTMNMPAMPDMPGM